MRAGALEDTTGVTATARVGNIGKPLPAPHVAPKQRFSPDEGRKRTQRIQKLRKGTPLPHLDPRRGTNSIPRLRLLQEVHGGHVENNQKVAEMKEARAAGELR